MAKESLPVDRSMSYATNADNPECGMDTVMCVYRPSKRGNWNAIHSLHTADSWNVWINKHIDREKHWKTNATRVNRCQQLTRCPSVLSWSGKHILHTSQWKKLFRPPIRQMPHPSQWYWSLSSSSNRLQIKQVNCKKKHDLKWLWIWSAEI